MKGKKLRVAIVCSRQASMPKHTKHKEVVEESRPSASNMEDIFIDLTNKLVIVDPRF